MSLFMLDVNPSATTACKRFNCIKFTTPKHLQDKTTALKKKIAAVVAYVSARITKPGNYHA